MKKIFPVLQYINVPNTLTTIGMGFGVVACYFIMARNLQMVFICVFLATFMDLLDGFFAGKLNQRTEFGQQADSLVDFFICCIVPMLVVYAFIGGGPLLIVSMIFYCMCGLWRLAHYNLATAKKYFTGLPVPGGLLFAAMSIWAVVRFSLPYWVCAIFFFLTGLLMISNIKLEKYGLWQKILWGLGLLFLVLAVIF